MTLGADAGSILRLILNDVAVLLAVGLPVGVGLALLAGRFIEKMLFDLKAYDMKTIVVAVAVFSIVALCAGFFTAHRAESIDPMVVLRDQ
jgi:ABC-type antimicrobial peptide transport system permease subunit